MKLLTIGNIIERKRLDLCARVCAILENEEFAQPFSWKIIGSGDKKAEIQAMAPKSMEFLSRVDSLKAHYQNSDIFVLPSYDEGFGLVYIESIMCGCPIIATQGEGAVEIVEQTGGGILIDVPQSDDQAVQNIMDAVRKIHDNYDQYMNDEVVKAAVNKMDPVRIKQEWEELINKCGGDPTRTEPSEW